MTMTTDAAQAVATDLHIQQLRAVRTRLLRFLDLVQESPSDGTQEHALVQQDLVEHLRGRIARADSSIAKLTTQLDGLLNAEEAQIEAGRRRAIEHIEQSASAPTKLTPVRPQLDDVWDDGVPAWVGTGRLATGEPQNQSLPRPQSLFGS